MDGLVVGCRLTKDPKEMRGRRPEAQRKEHRLLGVGRKEVLRVERMG